MWPKDFDYSTAMRGPGVFLGLLSLLFTEQDRLRLAAGPSPGQTTDDSITVLVVLFTRLRLPALKP